MVRSRICAFRPMAWALAVCLAAGVPAAAQDAAARRLALEPSLLTNWLDEANIHPPVSAGPLTFFPISADRAAKLDNAWTLDEALAAKQFDIEELEPAQIAKARFINRSDKYVLCLAGQVIEGGKQNRTLVRDALLAPDSRTVLDLLCVQKGRWEGGQSFAPRVSVAPLAVRSAASAGVGQDELWQQVRRANEQLGVQREDEDLVSAMQDKTTQTWLAEHRKKVLDALPRQCVGVVVARGVSFVGADLFNRAELFRAVREDVIDSYLLSIGPPSPAVRFRESQPTQEHCKEYLGRCYTARLTPVDSPGAGQLYRLSGDAHGTVLGFKGSWMVHTHLAERVIPVPPRPPQPPRPIPLPTPQPR